MAAVKLENVSKQRIGFQIAGPKAQQLLASITRADVSTAAFPFLSVREIDVGQFQAIVQRVSYTGDRGYEIYVPWHHQAGLYHLLTEAGKDLGLRPFGMRAMMSLRLDKSFGSWMREFKPDYTPLETGLDRFVDYNKTVDFIGKEAVLAEREQGVESQAVYLRAGGQRCGCRRLGANLAQQRSRRLRHFGWVLASCTKKHRLWLFAVELATEGREVEIEILGEMIPARLYTAPLFDPDNSYLRG